MGFFSLSRRCRAVIILSVSESASRSTGDKAHVLCCTWTVRSQACRQEEPTLAGRAICGRGDASDPPGRDEPFMDRGHKTS